MTVSEIKGFASRLLERAAGITGPLRPRIAPYFGTPEVSAKPLIEEETVERQAQTPEPMSPKDRSPVASEPNGPEEISAPRFPQSPPRGEPEEHRLMPRQEPPATAQAVSSDQAAEPSVTDAAAALPQTETPPAPDTKTALADVPVPPRQTPPPTLTAAPPERGPRQSVPVPDLRTALAAAVARLRPAPDPEPEAKLMPSSEPNRANEPPAPRETPAPVQRPRHPQTQDPQPLHVHIGEIVIAPDPYDMPAQRPATSQQTEWKPALTLDDYRDRRRKEGA
ncbi:hypothetical protein AB2B41_11335 [Marimonas sp. MJW-29]|uniref:Uncharacterized protein n=1 Tax=Sulfitobacter sediminis TaxID=3234186 RepID=A0ABV3RMJ2_9RHOB